MQIILAEDDEISRILLQVQLEQWGHSVLAARNGIHAWQLLQQNDCQVVITDWMMPEMSGIELLHKIRSSDRAGYVYVILLTSNSEKEALVTGLTSGADDFLTKPVDPYELQARLQPSRRIIELEPAWPNEIWNSKIEIRNWPERMRGPSAIWMQPPKFNRRFCQTESKRSPVSSSPGTMPPAANSQATC